MADYIGVLLLALPVSMPCSPAVPTPTLDKVPKQPSEAENPGIPALGTGPCSYAANRGFPKIRSALFGGPYNKDYSIGESLLGCPYLGKLPYWLTWYSLAQGEIIQTRTRRLQPQFCVRYNWKVPAKCVLLHALMVLKPQNPKLNKSKTLNLKPETVNLKLLTWKED